jgi:hypothetical protein
MTTIEREIRTGEAIQAGDYQIIPQTNVTRIRLPGGRTSLIWNRPKAVRVRLPDGQETSLAVRDVTRIAMWAMLVGGLVGVIMVGLMKRME